MHYQLTNLFSGETTVLEGNPLLAESKLRQMFPDALFFVPPGDITQCLQVVARMQGIFLTGDPVPPIEVPPGDGYNYDKPGSFPIGNGWPRGGDRSPYLIDILAKEKK